ncbi:MAG: HAMP domain-containing histidine kinase [Rhodospirillaceae bacterium]|nr:HAMP domain-containing histidine kinase [Rhodospirillaceae bacterium]
MVAAYAASLLVTVATSFALAWLLARHAGPVPGGRPLTAFIAGVGIFSCGPLSLAVWGEAASTFALPLFGIAALPPATYLHFALSFVRPACGGLPRWAAAWGYVLALAATAIGFALGIGAVAPWRGFAAAFLPASGGYVVAVAGAGLAAAAFLHLGLSLHHPLPALLRRQIALVLGASMLGLAACSGLAFPALAIDGDPWPVLLLPLFGAGMTFAVLRYRLMAVNVWARRTVTWILLVLVLGVALAGLGGLAATLGAIQPLGIGPVETWAGLALVLLSALVLATPLRRLADRLVFPGGQVSPATAEAWRKELERASDWDSLAATARTLLIAQFHQPVAVAIAPAAVGGTASGDRPALLCRRSGSYWHCDLAGWSDAPPGPRQAALVFAGLLRDAADRLDRALAFVAEAETRRRQAHLAELGQLAATVAHDLRNPLNTIAMAAAGADADIRGEIRNQLGRMDRLIADLLDYASAWKVEPASVDLREMVETAALGLPGLDLTLDLPPGLTVEADAHRLRRVFANLLANAMAAAGSAAPRVRVGAEPVADGWLRIEFSDGGCGVPDDLRDSLFQPFVSGDAAGTGLGLAIVARIAEAHGGTVALADPPPGWSTCIVLTLPAAPEREDTAHA